MNRALFLKELQGSLIATSIVAAVSSVYIAMAVSMFDPGLSANLDAMAASMPRLFEAFGMSTRTTTLVGFMLNYLYGFLLIVLPFALIMILVNRLIIRHLDRGTMAYLLSTPISRMRIALTQAGVLAASLATVAVIALATELISGQVLFPGELDVPALMRANAGLLCMWAFLAGTCFLSACAIPTAGAARWTGGGLCILALLMQMVSQVGDGLALLKDANPLTLFDAYGLAAGDGPAIWHAVLLGLMATALFGAAIAALCRRDLSV